MERNGRGDGVMMAERPIIFSGPMVRAILDGRKTQTRRICKHKGTLGLPPVMHAGEEAQWCPYGGPGDRLWIKETWWKSPVVTDRMLREGADTWPEMVWDADCTDADREEWREWGWKRHPSIFLRRDDARLTVIIERVRVERIQEITRDDAMAEGIVQTTGDHEYDNRTSTENFALLWDSLNAKRGFGWAANPWVWVVEFRTVS
jgi:hypothetical protein